MYQWPVADYVIGRETGVISTCGGVFADSGDLYGDYSDDENDVLTFCSDVQNHISIAFEKFNTESGSDLLYIYDGPNVNADQIVGSPFSGNGPSSSPGTITSTGTCLTFRYVSDSDDVDKGWEANIMCTGSTISSAANELWMGYPFADDCSGNSQIGGTVYEDINNDGDKDYNDPGFKGVKVILYDESGATGDTVITNATGDYTINGLSLTEVYRIEFEIPVGMEAGAMGAESNSAVQFVQANNCSVDFGLLDPAHYCNEVNPEWVIPCYINGDVEDPSNVGETGLARFLYNATGQSPATSYINKLTIDKIGSTWGVAYNTTSNDIYLSSFLKRHSGVGPAGIGAIYKHNLADNNSTVSTLYDFGAAAGVIPDVATRFPGSGDSFGEEGPCGSCDNVDASTFPQVGKVGFGDIDISSDNNTLFVVNLFDRKVYQINTDNPAANSATPLPSQPWLNNSICTNGVSRPWALKVRRGHLYVGAICDASGTSCATNASCGDLTAILYKYNLTTEEWSTELTFPLNYERTPFKSGSAYWARWIDNYADMQSRVYNITDAQFGQPIFCDIEFDDDGSLIMGFADRTAMQLGYQAPAPNQNSNGTADRQFSFGDILRASYNEQSGQYTMESNGSVGSLTTTNPYNTSGIGGKSFYYGDFWFSNTSNAGVGALAMLPGSSEVMFPVADALRAFSNGVVWMSNLNGKPNRKVEIYIGNQNNNASTFAKGSGVGDIQLICNGAPIEIGNHVWWDQNLNGLMDADEIGLAGVRLELYKDIDGNTMGNNAANGDEVLVARTKTDAYGRYVFSNNTNVNGLQPEEWLPTHTAVLPNMVYQVRVTSFTQDSALMAFQTAYNFATPGISPTQNQGVNGNRRDNNAYADGANAVASVKTGAAGSNNHSIDIGFGALAGCTNISAAPTSNTPCFGDTLKICTNPFGGDTPYTFSWTGPDNFTSTAEKPIRLNTINDYSGIYKVTVTDANLCTDTLSMLIEVNGVTATINATDTDCNSTSGAIDVIATGQSPFNYDWLHIAGTDNDQDLTNLDDGTYTVVITDHDGCTSEKSAIISNTNGPQITVNNIVHETCTGSNGSIDLTITGATGISWTNGSTNADINSLSAGTYTVTAMGSGCTTSATYTINNTAGPTISVNTTDATCQQSNGAIMLNVTGGTADYTYNWQHISGTDDPKDLSTLADGTYHVTVTDDIGCTASTSVVITNSPVVTLSVSVTDEACGNTNGAVNLSVLTGMAPYTFQWDNDGILDSDDVEDISNLSAGTYNVTVTDSKGCTATTSGTVANIGSPVISGSVTHSTHCTSDNGAIDISVTGGAGNYTYDWSNDGADNPDDDSQDLADLSPGIYTITVTDQNSCSATETFTIIQNNIPTISLSVTNPLTCLEKGSINTTVTGGLSPYTYKWTKDATPNFSSDQNISNLEAGVYSVMVTDAAGCVYTSQDTTITSITPLSVMDSVILAGCNVDNGEIHLKITDVDGSGPYTYSWADLSGSNQPQNRTSLAPSSYKVTISNELSCIDSVSVVLTADSYLTVDTVVTHDMCSAGSGGIAITANGTGPFTYSWTKDGNAFSNDEDLNNLSQGTYTVVVTDNGNSGCSTSASVTVIDLAAAQLTFTATHIDSDNKLGAIDLTVSGANPISYQWDNDGTSDNDDTQDIGNLSAGTYSVTVTDDNGCTSSTSVEIFSSDVALIKELVTDNATIQYGDTVLFKITIRNQGTLPVDEMIITDYIPTGFTFVNDTGVGGINEGWDGSNSTLPTFNWNISTLNQNDEDDIYIHLIVNRLSVYTAENYTNYAEISYASDLADNAIKDCDSDLNNDDGDNGGSLPNTPSDDEWDGDGTSSTLSPIDSTDQDNVDPAQICIFDLALDNKLVSHSGLYNPGDTATFQICIHNQGLIATDSIVISEYIPIGYIYSTSNTANGWDYNGSTRKAYKSITTGFPGSDQLDQGEHVCMDIDLVVDRGNMQNDDHITIAEINLARTIKKKTFINGNGVLDTMMIMEDVDEDVDSDFDDNPTNDPGGCLHTDSDDELNGNGNADEENCDESTDEDDSDPARVLLPFHSIGNQVWYDEDNNGQINGNEKGIEDVKVELYFINPSTQICEMVAIDSTDVNGYYLFSNLFGGDYIVAISADNFTGSASLSDYLSSTGGQSLDLVNGPYENAQSPIDANGNTDSDDNGLLISSGKMSGQVVSDTITLSDQEPLNESPNNDNVTSDDRSNLTVDFGFIKKTFDLALTKKFKYPDSTYVFGEEVEFVIDIFNQGNIDAKNIEITEYIPKSLTTIANPTANTGWTILGDTIARYLYTNTLLSGQSDNISFFATFRQASAAADYINCAEISKAEDTSGNRTDNNTLKDLDSTPDSIKNNDAGGKVLSPSDDYVLGDGTDSIGGSDPSKDEDDSDPAVLGYVDVALKKETMSTASVVAGDTVRFRITIYNQGSIALKNFEIVDYIPKGLELSTFGPSWSSVNDSTATYTLTSTLSGGDSASVDIVLTVLPSLNTLNAVNYAELCKFSFEDGSDATPFDIDSKADKDRTNDPGGLKNSPSDNVIIGDGNNGGGAPRDAIAASDEDDHDPSCVEFLDLALKKTMLNLGQPVKWGDVLTYQLIIYNQGNVAAKNAKVVDYIPDGLTYMTSNAPQWSLNKENNPITTITNTIPAGGSDTLHINLQVKQGAQVSDLINYAEISYFENENGEESKDFDSTPDDKEDNDGEINDDNTSNDGGDEDDHDIVMSPVFDLALRKTVASGHTNVVSGDRVVYMIEIFNQGTIDATAVEVADFAQNGLSFSSSDNPDWKPKGNHFEYIPTVNVAAGESTQIYITLVVNSGANNSNILNQAEIIGARNSQGVDMSLFDIDSKPDADFSNDVGGLVNSASDNQINGIGINDEDDADPALLVMCEPIACLSRVNVSVDHSCSVTITPSMILTDTLPYTSDHFDLDYFDLDGNPIDSIKINELINIRIYVPRCDTSDVICWSQVLIEDKLAPIIAPIPNDTIFCYQMDSINYPNTTDLCNYGGKVELVSQSFRKLCLNDTIIGISTRIFRAVDGAGNVSDTVSQKVYIKTPVISNIQFPGDTVVLCSVDLKDIDNLQKIDFGGPTFQGFDLTTDTLGICDIGATFEDMVIVNTPCKKQIMRMWTVSQRFCSLRDTMITRPQLITLTDSLPPVISVADTIQISGSADFNCMVTFPLPQLTAIDACDTSVTLTIYSDSIPTFYNGSTLRLPVDTHTLIVQAFDDCHNIANDTFVVILKDQSPPVNICLSKTTISLNNNGVANVGADAFDDGSFDACGNVTLSARRMTSTCDNPTITHGTHVEFCCADVGSEVMVEMLATDQSGNTSICMVTVTVQDKDIPSIICPPDITIDCNYVIGDLDIFGNVAYEGQQKALKIDPNDVVSASGVLVDGVAFGNCMDTISTTSTMNIDECNTGTITRTFTVRSRGGQEVSCNQVITIIHDDNAAKPPVTYPNDTIIVTCDPTAATPAITGRPTAEEGRCNLIGFSHTDELVTPLDSASAVCLKIIRTWTAHETCATPHKIIGTGTQTIYLEENQVMGLVIRGQVKSLHNEAVSAVAVDLSTKSNDLNLRDETDNQGEYAFPSMSTGGEYAILPYKNHDWNNGISTLDLIQIQNHVLGKGVFTSGYKQIAADINNDKNISAIDLVMLRKIILGIDNEVKGNTSWRFIWSGQDLNGEYDLNSPLMEKYDLASLQSDMNIDWVGVKVGDLSGNAVANGIESTETRSNDKITLNWEVTYNEVGKKIDFYLPSIIDFNGMQGEILLPKNMRLASFVDGQIKSKDMNLHYDTELNSIKFSIAPENNLEVVNTLPIFSWVVDGPGDLSNNVLKLASQYVNAEVYSFMKARGFQLEQMNTEADKFIVDQNEPNPWAVRTSINVDIPSDGDVELKVFDVQGQILVTKTIPMTKGPNVILLDKDDISITGVLLYEITYGSDVISNKMIKME